VIPSSWVMRVILSAAKDLVRRGGATEILRCAQDDTRTAKS